MFLEIPSTCALLDLLRVRIKEVDETVLRGHLIWLGHLSWCPLEAWPVGTSVVSRVPLCHTVMYRLCPEGNGEPPKGFMQESDKEAGCPRRMTQASVWRMDYRREPGAPGPIRRWCVHPEERSHDGLD